MYTFQVSFFIFFLCLKRVSLPAADNRFELFHTDIPCILFLTFKLSLFMFHMYRYYIRFFKTSECCFFKLFKQNLLLSCECGSEFRFAPHNIFKQSAFVCAASPALFKKAATVSDSRRVSYTTLLAVVLFPFADNRCADNSSSAGKQQCDPQHEVAVIAGLRILR